MLLELVCVLHVCVDAYARVYLCVEARDSRCMSASVALQLSFGDWVSLNFAGLTAW